MSEYKLGAATGSYTISGTEVNNPDVPICIGAAFKAASGSAQPFASITQGGLVTALLNGTAPITAQGGKVVNQTSSVASGTVTSVTTVFPKNQGSGNTNIVAISWPAASGSVSSVTDSAGNTYSAAGSAEQANGASTVIYFASPIFPYSVGAGNSVMVAFSGAGVSNPTVKIAEYPFTVASSVQDGSAVNSTGASGKATASVTTVNANDEVVCSVMGAAGQVTTTGAPFTIEATSANGDALIDAPAYAAGSLAASSSLSGGGWVSQCVALKVVAGTDTVTIGTQAVSNVFYLAPSNASPPGNDSNAGTQASPYLTFTKALAAMSTAGCPGASGCILYLENGTYGPSTGTGFASINCATGGNAANGTSSAPMTLQAVNERQAWLKGDGSGQPFSLVNCAYWTTNGLHVSDTDYSTPATPGVMSFQGDTHFTISRNLVDHTNRCQNAHAITLDYGNSNGLIQENEVYYYHRHAIISYSNSNSNELRRNYSNYRNYGLLSCYQPSGTPPVGAGVQSYGSSTLTEENNIAEGGTGLGNEPVTGGPYISNVAHYGDINLNSDGGGITVSSHEAVNASAPANISFSNDVVINAASVSAYFRCATGSALTNVSIFNNSYAGSPVIQDSNGGVCGSGVTESITISHSEIVNQANLAVSTGFNIANGNSTISNSGSFASTAISNASVSNPFTGNPGFGNCLLWPPDGSAAATAGVGATILYATEGGTINTGKPLWNSSGQFSLNYRGAIVAGGVNDPATYPGQTLADVGGRLNVNQGGCSFPGAYTPAP